MFLYQKTSTTKDPALKKVDQEKKKQNKEKTK